MSEQRYLTLSEAAKLIPAQHGKHPSTQSLFRWTQQGCRGIKLESLRFGRRIVTTPEMLDDFARALSKAWATDTPSQHERKSSQTRTPSQRESAIQAAEQSLRDCGVLS